MSGACKTRGRRSGMRSAGNENGRRGVGSRRPLDCVSPLPRMRQWVRAEWAGRSGGPATGGGVMAFIVDPHRCTLSPKPIV